MTELLKENVKGQVKEALAQMQHPVQALFFGFKKIATFATTPANWLRKYARFQISLA